MSSTVERILSRFDGHAIGARQVIETVLETHSEYAGGLAEEYPIAWPATPGAVADPEEYLRWIGDVYAPDAFGGKLHGRAAILGAGLVDRAVGRELVASGLFGAIRREVDEDFESVLSADGRRRYESIPLAGSPGRPPVEIVGVQFPVLAAQSPDGRWIATINGNQVSICRGAEPVAQIELPDVVVGLAIGPAGRQVIVGLEKGWGIVTAADGGFSRVEPGPSATGSPFTLPDRSGTGGFAEFIAAADGSRLFAAVPRESEVRSLDRDGEVRIHEHDEGPGPIRAVSPSGLFLVRESMQSGLSVLDVRTGERRHHDVVPEGAGAVAVDDDGRLAYARSLDVPDGTSHLVIHVGNRSQEYGMAQGPALAFSPDGRLLAGVGADGITLIDTTPRPTPTGPEASLIEVATLPVDRRITTLSFSGYGHHLLATDGAGFVGQWEVGLTPPPLPPAPLAYTADMADGRGDDLMNIDPAVDAFASLIAARDLEPPLSVGIFGEWGSGKTFFMRRLHDRIQDRSRMARESGLLQREVSFAKRIVQVEFNAWHYSGGKLWAALVQHMFENLSLFGDEPEDEVLKRQKHILAEMRQLDEQREALIAEEEQAADEVEEATSALVVLEQQHRDRLAELRQLTPADVVDVIEGDGELRKELRDLARELGLADATSSAASLYGALQQTRALLQRAGPMMAVGEGRGRWHTRWALLATALSGPAVAAAAAPLSAALGLDRPEVASAISGLAMFFGSASMWVTKQNDWLKQRIQRTESMEAALTQRVRAAEAEFELQRAAKEKEIDALAGQLASVRAEVARADADRSALEARLEDLTPASVLAEYIMERAASDDYRQHLGLHARIKDDFDRIAGIMDRDRRAVRDAPTLDDENRDADHRIDRIVLYIDDLDRCEPEKVVEVLGAVHLLLAFPLFVVVVGIDARWASRALRERYPELLGDDRGAQATPEDYLEKIFQVPFWLPPLDSAATAEFVTGIVGTGTGGTRAPRPDGQSATIPAAGASQTGAQPPAAAAPAPATSQFTPPARPELNPAALQMGDAERNFMREVSPLLGTSPRAIKRFVNLYRLAKAMASDPLDFVTERPRHGAPYEAVMILLAIDTGAPEDARELFAALSKWRPAGGAAEDLGAACAAITDPANRTAGRLAAWVKEDARRRELHMQLVRSWAPTIAQFSFRAGEAAADGRVAAGPRHLPM